MKPEIINSNWPNALRWFLVQNTESFCPWHFLSHSTEFESAAKAFANEDTKNRMVFVFASRQDNDDFAGLEIVDGTITDKVIVFHPVFGSGKSYRSWDVVETEYNDVFEFLSNHIVQDMKDWALTEDASDLLG
ncbi:hypothetical protein AMS58_20920 [Pseudoalteromonas porphyrae]|uniref:Uncharacterized protein n=1 Tax=Pseudoalteromonas porphyrae TaxID=187330 RepID=A0A0N0LUQ5_9GAMM|nr:hypothetical protein [Pseudoalteromonas porphyrae]KPH56669.1 hypothetical protein ADS77_20820 [Pseudoalteromonas porphyrae]KPH92775.1 hypothetical protein AMS58_20920 [Pseudoalteromonas porphyrae]